MMPRSSGLIRSGKEGLDDLTATARLARPASTRLARAVRQPPSRPRDQPSDLGHVISLADVYLR